MSDATIVTGAASGIGRATAERLAADGSGVVAVDLDRDRLDWVDGEQILAVAGDVTDEKTYATAIEVAVGSFGLLRGIALNAGIGAGGDLVEMPLERFDRAMEVNVRGVLLGIRAVTPVFRTSGGGRIVVTASTSGIRADPMMWAYNASKAAVINLVRAAAVDLAAEQINVNAVCPGPTETPLAARLHTDPELGADMARRIPAQRWGRPEEVAAVIAFLLSDDASFMHGAIVPVDGGITANAGQFTPRPRQESR